MRKICKVGVKLICLLFPYFVICPFMVSQFPMRFMDDEYSYYFQNKEYSEEHEKYARILIMGDSTAKAAWLPRELSEDTYNFALGGASPIEEYYYLYDYLQDNDAPRYVIYTQGPFHFLNLDTFWSRSVYFHRMKDAYFQDMIMQLKNHEGISILGYDNVIDIKKERLFYKIYHPSKYSKAFLSGLLFPKRYEENIKRYKTVVEAEGQIQFGTAKGYNGINKYAEYNSFQALEIMDFYFKRIIELCENSHIKFIFQNAPVNESTYRGLNRKFVTDYENYLSSVQESYPDAVIDTKLFDYNNCYFGDTMHLNMNGTIKFSSEMRKKYHDIFVPE